MHHILSLHKLASKVAHCILGLGHLVYNHLVPVLGEKRKLPRTPFLALCDGPVLQTLFDVFFYFHQPHIHVNENIR